MCVKSRTPAVRCGACACAHTHTAHRANCEVQNGTFRYKIGIFSDKMALSGANLALLGANLVFFRYKIGIFGCKMTPLGPKLAFLVLKWHF